MWEFECPFADRKGVIKGVNAETPKLKSPEIRNAKDNLLKVFIV